MAEQEKVTEKRRGGGAAAPGEMKWQLQGDKDFGEGQQWKEELGELGGVRYNPPSSSSKCLDVELCALQDAPWVGPGREHEGGWWCLMLLSVRKGQRCSWIGITDSLDPKYYKICIINRAVKTS